MARILICEFMDLPAVAQLQRAHEVLYDPELVDQPARLLDEAARADALIVRNRTQVRDALLAALTRARVVGRLGVGLDNIDLPGCAQRGIQVVPATGANALSVAEYVIGSAMLLLRGAYQSSQAVAAGAWPRTALSNGREMHAKTLGLIGFGTIGQTTCRLARCLGMRVVAFDAMLDDEHPVFAELGVQPLGLDALLASADVVSLHVPLNEGTRHLLDAGRIAGMKPGAVLVNSARGGVVDEPALATALRAGALGGAALDVFEHEPLPAAEHFVGCPNLLLTPHIAGVTTESNARVSSLIAERVLEALA
jgi:(S)-sulfolactate dehydrogenase